MFEEYQLNKDQRLSHLFFGHVESIENFKQNCDVILMDCTYSTNYFDMTLLNIIGNTGMNKTVHLAQAFLNRETFNDFLWTMTELKKLLTKHGIPFPQVIFTDRDLALSNALEIVFPSIPALLCLWHIIKDVETHARTNDFPKVIAHVNSTRRTPKKIDCSIEHRVFCDTFIALTRSRSLQEYELYRARLYALSKQEAQYIDEIWLDIWKYKIVRCWTNNVVHFGIQSTSRVEGYHHTFEQWLGSSRGDLLTAFNHPPE